MSGCNGEVHSDGYSAVVTRVIHKAGVGHGYTDEKIREKVRVAMRAACLMVFAVLMLPAAAQGVSAAGGQRLLTLQQTVGWMTKKQSLIGDQQSKLLPVITTRDQKLQTICADTSLQRREKFRERKAVAVNSDRQINAILNDQQREKYAQIEQRARERMKQRIQDRTRNGSRY